jgi:hypothetical protein
VVKVDGKDQVKSLKVCLLPGSLAFSHRAHEQLDGKQTLAQVVLASYGAVLFIPGGQSSC